MTGSCSSGASATPSTSSTRPTSSSPTTSRRQAAGEKLGKNKGAEVSIVRWNPDGPSWMENKQFASGVALEMGLKRPKSQDKDGNAHTPSLSLEKINEIDGEAGMFHLDADLGRREGAQGRPVQARLQGAGRRQERPGRDRRRARSGPRVAARSRRTSSWATTSRHSPPSDLRVTATPCGPDQGSPGPGRTASVPPLRSGGGEVGGRPRHAHRPVQQGLLGRRGDRRLGEGGLVRSRRLPR